MNKPTFTLTFPITTAAIAAASATTTSYAVKISARFPKTVDAIRAAVDAGEIIVSRNKELRESINRFVEAAGNAVVKKDFDFHSLPTALGDLFWDIPSEARLIPGFQKKLDKVANTYGDHPFVVALTALMAELKELADVVAYLKTIEVKATVKRETAKVQKEQEAKCRNLTDKVYQAVLPMKERAVEEAEKQTRQWIAQAIITLESAGFDIDAVAPSGDYKNDSEITRKSKDARRQFFFSFTTIVQHGRNKATIVEVSQEKIELEVDRAKRDAAVQFEAYVAKLNAKINDEVLEATLSTRTNGVWFDSTLTVVTRNKGTQKWKTQIIVNFSVYGRAFNQFPTRLVK